MFGICKARRSYDECNWDVDFEMDEGIAELAFIAFIVLGVKAQNKKIWGGGHTLILKKFEGIFKNFWENMGPD